MCAYRDPPLLARVASHTMVRGVNRGNMCAGEVPGPIPGPNREGQDDIRGDRVVCWRAKIAHNCKRYAMERDPMEPRHPRFKTGALNHSATLPFQRDQSLSKSSARTSENTAANCCRMIRRPSGPIIRPRADRQCRADCVRHTAPRRLAVRFLLRASRGSMNLLHANRHPGSCVCSLSTPRRESAGEDIGSPCNGRRRASARRSG
jgi:hypothetical protein